MLLGLSSPLQAWDESGHRFTADVTYALLADEIKQDLFEILTHHPRYQQDFINAMPRGIQRGSFWQRQVWLLGRAAFWPDIARRLSRQEQEKYNHPSWHYIDGALLRSDATIQGNNYIGIAPLPSRQSTPAENNIVKERVTNILQALDYNAALLNDTDSSKDEKAIALCWMLHLIGDIHQPLHTGSLFSAQTFPDGDAGGNRIETNGRTLHSTWDRALAEFDPGQLRVLLTNATQNAPAQLASEVQNWPGWMHESRVILRSESVYSQQIRAAIDLAEQRRTRLVEIPLGNSYLANMKRIAIDRLNNAGLRQAAWFNHNHSR